MDRCLLAPYLTSTFAECILRSMTTWETRKAVGDELEQRVAEELTIRGWTVSPYGQGTFDPAIRTALGKTPSSIRYQPDLIAARGELVVLIDCKGRMTSTTSNRHSIQRDAVQAHLQYSGLAGLPVYYVFDDLGVLTPHEVLTAGRMGPHTQVGSNAPYFLIAAALARPFDAVFGSYETVVEQWAKRVA